MAPKSPAKKASKKDKGQASPPSPGGAGGAAAITPQAQASPVDKQPLLAEHGASRSDSPGKGRSASPGKRSPSPTRSGSPSPAAKNSLSPTPPAGGGAAAPSLPNWLPTALCCLGALVAVVGFGLGGGAVWKMWSVVGGDHHDHHVHLACQPHRGRKVMPGQVRDVHAGSGCSLQPLGRGDQARRKFDAA